MNRRWKRKRTRRKKQKKKKKEKNLLLRENGSILSQFVPVSFSLYHPPIHPADKIARFQRRPPTCTARTSTWSAPCHDVPCLPCLLNCYTSPTDAKTEATPTQFYWQIHAETFRLPLNFATSCDARRRSHLTVSIDMAINRNMQMHFVFTALISKDNIRHFQREGTERMTCYYSTRQSICDKTFADNE